MIVERRALVNGVAMIVCAAFGADLMLSGNVGAACFCFAMALINLIFVIVWVVKP